MIKKSMSVSQHCLVCGIERWRLVPPEVSATPRIGFASSLRSLITTNRGICCHRLAYRLAYRTKIHHPAHARCNHSDRILRQLSLPGGSCSWSWASRPTWVFWKSAGWVWGAPCCSCWSFWPTWLEVYITRRQLFHPSGLFLCIISDRLLICCSKDVSSIELPEDYPFPESVLDRGRDFR